MHVGLIFSNAQSTIEGYEYWFNYDFTNRISASVIPTKHAVFNQSIPTSGLISGINVLNFRSFDNSGKYSSILSHYFYKIPVAENNSTPEIVAYEYWFDKDRDSAVVVTIFPSQQVDINRLFSTTSLSNGIHCINIRFKNNSKLWSNIVSHFFYKTPQKFVLLNQVTEYRYWIDNDFDNAVMIPLPPDQQINVIANLDIKQIQKGAHEINFQFKDTLGKWSVVISDSIHKVSFPIASFSHNINPGQCDSTVVAFTNRSVDGDKYIWNFGDENTSSDINPSHTYKNPGIYTVSLSITDTITLADSTITQSIMIAGNTSASLTITACNRFVSPSGKYTLTASGIHKDTIPNHWGCDSLLTINLTINHSPDISVTQNGIILTSNAIGVTYQWLDCDNGFRVLTGETNQSITTTKNGRFAVMVSQNGCSDTSICYAINSVGIIENSFGHDVLLYPNPTDGKLTIVLGEEYGEIMVIISSSKGQVIRTLNYKNISELELNVIETKGIYFITLISKNQKAIMKVIKY